MSLKAFHIAFVILTTVTSLFVGGWGWMQFLTRGNNWPDLLMGIGGIAFAVGMLVYGRYVLKKLKDISYL